MKLFCFPYAGGSETVYYKWKKYLDPSIEMHLFELKGRGKRINEPFYKSLDEAVEDVYNFVTHYIDHDEYALFGHSMGSRIAYKLYYKLHQKNKRKPYHLFLSGSGIPTEKKESEMTHRLPDDIFMQKIAELGGTSEEFLKNEDLLALYRPILRNDFRILELDTLTECNGKIESNLTILYGNEDKLGLDDLKLWNDFTQRKCEIVMFKGDHFFINKEIKGIATLINNTLLYSVSKFSVQ